MKLFILITGIGEILVGLLMLLAPSRVPIYSTASGLARSTARMYGAAAFSIGLFAVLVALHFEVVSLHHPFLIVYLVFHVLVTASILLGRSVGEPGDKNVAILHAVLAAATAYFLFL
jgi:hypothetical protein